VKIFGYYIVHEREAEYQASRLQAWMDIAMRWRRTGQIALSVSEAANYPLKAMVELLNGSPELIDDGPCSRCKDPTKAERYKDNVDFILG
jgi:hypothetical protein